jgi:ABC-type nitrate/sulfonate/bicarbonate transport system substrate-binding protein
MAEEPHLRTVTRTQGNNASLKSGAVVPRGFTFDFEEVPVLVQAFRRMVRGLEFDISEMALTTYLVAKAHGVRFTGLPIFLVRGFHHGAVQVHTAAGIDSPKDLEGHRVGVNRGYTVTTGVWARAVLEEEHGVDLDTITWVLSGDEHVAGYRPPRNVVPIGPDSGLEDMLRNGELAAVIGADIDAADVAPLIPDAEEAGLVALRQHGRYPINHLIVVRDEVLAAHPGLAEGVFDAFARAKTLYVDQLRAGTLEAPTAADRTYARVMAVTGADPLPYGLAPNRAVLEDLLRHAVSQSILDRAIDLDDMFAPSTHDLTA